MSRSDRAKISVTNPVRTMERVLPFIIAVLLPVLNLLNNVPFTGHWDFWAFAPRWALVSTFMLALWFLNEKLTRLRKGALWVSVLIAGNLLFIATFILVEYGLMPAGLNFPETVSRWSIGIKLTLAAALFVTIQQTLKSIKENERLRSENYALLSENYKAQLEQLQKQVNPHFLFNSLSTLRTMIRSEDRQSEEFVLKLSDVYRRLLQTRESNVVSLKEELGFLDAYLYLIKVRHDDALTISIHIFEDAMAYSVPVFALQLLVENCIKHNIISGSHPLHVWIEQRDHQSVTVRNNFQPKKKNVQSFGMGLENLRKRYQLMGIDNGVEIRNDEKQYAVTLKLF